MSDSARALAEGSDAEAPKRQRRPVAEKRRIVEESYAAGSSVARVARAHGVNANQVFTWRRQYQRGLLGGRPAATLPVAALVPVTVSDAPARPEPIRGAAPGTIRLQFAKGRLSIEGAVDAASLRVVLECLLA
ncbi:MAG TPA: transposase [Bryobacteraceae bacterium]|nr:transposase [Bryobacteraceae bacterium]